MTRWSRPRPPTLHSNANCIPVRLLRIRTKPAKVLPTDLLRRLTAGAIVVFSSETQRQPATAYGSTSTELLDRR